MTANSGYDANTGEELEDGADRELPGTVTLLVTPEQSMGFGRTGGRWKTAFISGVSRG